MKSETLLRFFLFLLILFQDVSWHASKIYFDMIWITKKKSNLIIKDNAPFFWTLFFFDKFIFFFEILPSVLYSNFVLFFLIVMVTMKIALYNAKAKFNFWSHQSARDTEQDERIFCPNSLLHNGIKMFLKSHMPSCDYIYETRTC